MGGWRMEGYTSGEKSVLASCLSLAGPRDAEGGLKARSQLQCTDRPDADVRDVRPHSNGSMRVKITESCYQAEVFNWF